MDFLSRDQQRQAVEELAPPSGEGQVRVALKAIESARQAAASGSTARSRGPRRLSPRRSRTRAISKPTSPIGPAPATRAPARRCCATPPVLYLGAIAVADRGPASPPPSPTPGTRARSPAVQVAVALLVLLPASDLAIACIQRAVVHARRARSGCRASTSPTGVPDSARTMVIVPTMLTSAAGVDALLEHVEVLALGNLDPCVHFAILSDFADTGDARRARTTRRSSSARARGRRGAQRQVRRRARRSLLPVPPRPAVERGRAARGSAGSGSAARSRSSIACCAARRTRASRRRSASSTCCRRSATASRSTPTRVCRATPRSGSSASSRIR